MNYPDSNDLYQGKFTDGDPLVGRLASVASAEHMNAIYDELKALITAGGLAPDFNDLAQVSQSVGSQLRSKRLFDVSGTANAILLTTPAGKQPVTTLNDYDEFSFIVSATNTDVMTIAVDDLAAVSVVGVTEGVQVIKSALLTVRYVGGSFFIANQINPLTGNQVSDIGMLKWRTLDAVQPYQMHFDAGELSRATHPILFAMAEKTGLIDQTTKDADLENYGGFWGDGDGATTFTVPLVDKIIKPTSAARTLGSYEGDAIRNIYGAFGVTIHTAYENASSGALAPISTLGSGGGSVYDGSSSQYGFLFNASLVVPTGPENTPKTIAFHPVFCV